MAKTQKKTNQSTILTKKVYDIMDKISLALVSGPIPKDFSNPYYSFVFEEAYKLAQKGINIHAIRCFKEKDSTSFGINYYGLKSSLETRIPLIIKHNKALPWKSYLIPPWSLMSISNYARTVSNVVRQQNLDLIHGHFAYPEGFVGLLAKYETKKPLVVTVHGSDILVEPSTGYGIRLSSKYDAVVRKVLQEADAIIAASKTTFNEVCNIVKNSEKVHLIPNGVDTLRFNPNVDFSALKHKLSVNNKFVVFSLRSHEPKYGLEYLIRSVKIVTNQRDDVLFIIGGEGSLRQYHEKLAFELGVKDKIIFAGKISSEDLPMYYGLSYIVVVPSLQEAFGLVVSEAMASGKPVIGSNVGGIRDQINEGYTGFLIEPRDPIKIAEKILWLINNQKEANIMGFQGKQEVSEKFNIEKRTDHIKELYLKLIQKRTMNNL
jgi:glycosyltransferase involved in cell wall biosynthesis